MKILLLFTTLCLVTEYTLGVDNLLITAYVESLCPFCKAFITGQLYPTKQQLGDAIDIQLVPYGKASREQGENGSWNFTCQHGPDECYGNKAQSCAVEIYPDEALEFVYCAELADTPAADEVLENCADSTNISWDTLKSCVDSSRGDELLAANGEVTDAANIQHVPTITFNNRLEDVANETLQNSAVVDLLGLVCEFLDNAPEGC